MICVEINLPYNRSFLVSTWYTPPSAAIDLFAEHSSFIEKCDCENMELIILGDMNCDYLSPFYRTKFSLTNFMYQMYFDSVNEVFLTHLSKNPNLHSQKTFDIRNLSKKIWSCKRALSVILTVTVVFRTFIRVYRQKQFSLYCTCMYFWEFWIKF